MIKNTYEQYTQRVVLTSGEYLRQALSMLKSRLGSRQGDRQSDYDYDIFRSAESREELFLIGKGIAEYVHNNDIGTVCFVDRSARPAYVALSEYWGRAYRGVEKPDIRFINPKGCISVEEVQSGRRNLTKLMINDQYKQGQIEDPENLRPEKEIVDEIRLINASSQKSDKPVLVFDACIHSGDSIFPVIDKLLRADVSDVRVGTVSDYEMEANIDLDLQILNGVPDKVCYPFGHDRMTTKTYGSVVANSSGDSGSSREGALIREEIKRAIDEQWKLRSGR